MSVTRIVQCEKNGNYVKACFPLHGKQRIKQINWLTTSTANHIRAKNAEFAEPKTRSTITSLSTSITDLPSYRRRHQHLESKSSFFWARICLSSRKNFRLFSWYSHLVFPVYPCVNKNHTKELVFRDRTEARKAREFIAISE